MRIIRTGASRTVILIGRYAVKVPSLRGAMTRDARGRVASFATGILANQSEYLWSRYRPWAGRVAPVLHSWLLGLVQVYPRCAPLDDADDDERGRAALPRLEPDPGDVKADNYGRLPDGRIVRLDYDMK